MAASQIEAIITAIAGISVTADSITPTVYYGDTLKQGGDNAPMRVILPSDVDSDTRGVKFGNLNTGTFVTVVWNISDLFLFKNVSTGSGLAEAANTLIRYAGAYAAALVGHQNVIANSRNVGIEGVGISIGAYQFPVGSGIYYYGVETRYQIREIIA